MIFRGACTLSILIGIAGGAAAQHLFRSSADTTETPIAGSRPVIDYTLRVDLSDLSGYEVGMRVRNLPDTFRVAMAIHPEYDDRFWRYVENFRVESPGGRITREDSAQASADHVDLET